MKLICLIISIYVVLLSTVPCCSDGDCIGVVSSKSSKSLPSQEGMNDCATCSPFLTCANSLGFTFKEQTIQFNKLSVSVEKIVSPYLPISLYSFTTKIWQPPRRA